jgi:RNA polymerase sigma-19 factor, ECF subfamily
MTLSISEYETIFKSNHKALCNAAYRITHHKASAEDIVQNVFLKLWDRRDEINITSSVGAYLYKSTINACLNYLEANKRQLSGLEEIRSATAFSEENTSQGLSLKELEALIEKLLLGLPPKCRAIFILNRYEGLRYKQIAEHLGISVNTVENQMSKALSVMRDGLRPYLTKEFLVISISAGISVLLQCFSVMAAVMVLKHIF